MKHYLKVLTLLLALAISACKSLGPQIDQGILTVIPGQDPVADFVKPNGTLYEIEGIELDGFYLISPRDRQTLLIWAKANCKNADFIRMIATP